MSLVSSDGWEVLQTSVSSSLLASLRANVRRLQFPREMNFFFFFVNRVLIILISVLFRIIFAEYLCFHFLNKNFLTLTFFGNLNIILDSSMIWAKFHFFISWNCDFCKIYFLSTLFASFIIVRYAWQFIKLILFNLNLNKKIFLMICTNCVINSRNVVVWS